MLSGKKDAVAILYHNYESHDDYDICINYQESLKKEFISLGVESVELEHEMGGDLIDNVARLSHTLRATLVVMGITGKSAIRQAMFGSNTLKLIDKNLIPVMIIPPDARYQGIKNVAFASDFKNVEDTTPSTLINSVLEMFQPVLHIVNVQKDIYISITDEMKAEKEKLKEMFSNYKTEFYFISRADFFATRGVAQSASVSGTGDSSVVSATCAVAEVTTAAARMRVAMRIMALVLNASCWRWTAASGRRR